MATLTGNTVSSTYESLIKLADNSTLNASTTELLSDGAGNNLPLKASQTTIEFTGNVNFNTATVQNLNTSDLTNDSGFITISDVNTATGSLSASLATDIASNLSAIESNDADILGLDNEVSLLQSTASFLVDSASLAIVTASATDNTITFTKGGGDTFNITIDTGSNGVTSLNGLDGAVTLSAGTNITFDVVGNDIEINSSGGGGGSDSFNTFTVPSQPDVVADSGNDTMNFVDGAGISMTTNNTTKTITFDVDGLGNTPLLFNSVWVGNGSNLPSSVLLPSLTVGNATNATSATTATNAVKARVNTVTSGAYRVLLGNTSFIDDEFTDLYADLSGGITYNPSGDILTVGSLSAANNVVAGGTLSGGALDISGGADIDGTLSLGGIGNVENEINQNTSDIATLQAIPQVAPIVNETTGITISDDTYNNKFIVIDAVGSVDIELDDILAWEPPVGTEIYFMSLGGDITIINYDGTVLVPTGKSEVTFGANSVAGIKCIITGSSPSTGATWVMFGDLA